MKLKLTSSEFVVLHMLLKTVCENYPPRQMQKILLHGVLFRLYSKFYKRAIMPKKKYSISIDDMEAAAFYLFFSKYDMTGEDVFTINMVTKLNNSIHKLFPL